MKNALSRLLTIIAVLLASLPLKAESDDEQKAAEVKIPAESEKWTVDFEGFAGTPGDRSRFHLKVSHEGAVEVKAGRFNSGKLVKGEFTPEELHKFYKSVSKILKEYDKTRSTGGADDGWSFTLKLKGDSSGVSAKYGCFGDIEEASPEFMEIQKLINKKFPKVSFPE